MGSPELIIPIMAIIWPMLALIIFVYVYFTTRTKVKLALIESGRDASIFRGSGQSVNRLLTLKQGVICLMAGLGLIVGAFFEKVTNWPEPVAYLVPLLLFIGSGLVGFYLFFNKQVDKDRMSDELIETL